jgi:hypothetical protein
VPGARAQAAVAALAAAAATALVLPTTGAAGGTTGFSIRPGHYDPNDASTRAYFDRKVAAGASFSDDVVVTNGGSQPVTLLVYPVDGVTGQTSGAVYGNRGAVLRRAGRWLRPGASRVTVAGGKAVGVPFTVRVPPGSLPGDHLAGLAFEDTHVTTSGGRFRIRQVIREVIGVLVRVPGPAQPVLQLGRLTLSTLPGTGLAAVVVPIANVGRSLCKPRLTVSLSAGAFRERITRQLDTILPADRIPYPLVLRHGLQPKTYRIDARTSCLGSTVQRSSVVRLGSRLRGSADPAPPVVVTTGGRSGFPVWVIVLIAVLAAAGGVGAGSVLRLRRATT